jgi:hypothetical protein
VEFRILLRASEIPEGSIVTKRTGEKEYELVRSVSVYGQDGGPIQIDAQDGNVFLGDGGNKFQAFSCSKELMWKLEESDLLAWLYDREMERESK